MKMLFVRTLTDLSAALADLDLLETERLVNVCKFELMMPSLY